jgi:hypothetical protein
MKLLICGGREYGMKVHKTSRHPVIRLHPRQIRYLFTTLDRIHAETPIDAVIEGCAPGADALGGIWAALRGIPVEEFPADWDKDGSSAGPIRNRRQFKEGKPDRAAAFEGGAGTADMVKVMRQGGKTVVLYESGDRSEMMLLPL